jgi:hypothetical protein
VADQLAVGLRDEVELRDEGGVGADPMDDEGFLGAGLREVPEGVEGELLGGAVVGAPFLTNDQGFSLDGYEPARLPVYESPPTTGSPTGSAPASRSSRKQNARSSCAQPGKDSSRAKSQRSPALEQT